VARLTDEYVNEICRDTGDSYGPSFATADEVRSMAAELRERRGADLTSEEREALRTARAMIEVRFPSGHVARFALSALDKLLGKADS
jgi:hypothetical protein